MPRSFYLGGGQRAGTTTKLITAILSISAQQGTRGLPNNLNCSPAQRKFLTGRLQQMQRLTPAPVKP